jgi:FkbM family methyltransferase
VWIFEIAYDLYKHVLEARAIGALAHYVIPGSCILDVGANIGFFTLRFARWTSGQGSVLAFEPEPRNLARLRSRLRQRRPDSPVEVIPAAVGDSTGTAYLVINELHPGDHKLGATGVPVPMMRLDDILAGRTWPAVCLIKIDVQGAEMAVIRGAAETLRRLRPALFVEVDDRNLRAMGASARELLELIAAFDYSLNTVDRRGRVGAIDPATAGTLLEGPRKYRDVLCLPIAGGPSERSSRGQRPIGPTSPPGPAWTARRRGLTCSPAARPSQLVLTPDRRPPLPAPESPVR